MYHCKDRQNSFWFFENKKIVISPLKVMLQNEVDKALKILR